jgi:hypothetical protein
VILDLSNKTKKIEASLSLLVIQELVQTGAKNI